MAWSYGGLQNSNNGSGSGSLTVALNGTTAGRFIAVGASVFNNTGTITGVAVSDGTNGAYTQSFFVTRQSGTTRQATSLHYFPNNAGGDLTITVDPSDAGTDSYDFTIFAAEFAGGDTTSPASGTPVTNSATTGTTASTGTTSPADNDVLVIAVDGNDTSGTITENAGGEGFTLIAEHESGVSAEPGSWVYRIISGSPGTPSHSWTVPSGVWAVGIAAFKPAAGAAASVRGPLLGGGGITPNIFSLLRYQ